MSDRPRSPLPPVGAPGAVCESCAAALAPDQRYCLACGTRRRDAVGDVRDRAAADAGAAARSVPTGGATARGGRPVPAAAIAFGVAIGVALWVGAVAGPNASETANAAGAQPGLVVALDENGNPVAVPAATVAPAAAASLTPSSLDTTSDPVVEQTVAEVTAAEPPAETPAAETPAAATTTDTTPTDTTPTDTTPTDPDAPVTPAVKNVWIVGLGSQTYASLFAKKGGSKALTGTLAKDGVILSGYHALAHGPLASTVALVSGQGPNPALQAGCPTPAPFPAGDLGKNDQALGSGCIFSDSVFSIADQVGTAGGTWRAYGGGLDGKACADPSLAPTLPFLRFTTVTTATDCADHLGGLERLKSDLGAAKTTPLLSYLVPDPCHDAGATPCQDGAATGPTTADAYLTDVVGQITASAAYRDGGLVAIVPSDAPGSGPGADSSSCCERPTYPNTEDPGTESEPGPGGGLTGALLLSPLAKAGTVVDTPTDTLDLLRSISEGLSLRPLGLAADDTVKGLGAEVWK